MYLQYWTVQLYLEPGATVLNVQLYLEIGATVLNSTTVFRARSYSIEQYICI